MMIKSCFTCIIKSIINFNLVIITLGLSKQSRTRLKYFDSFNSIWFSFEKMSSLIWYEIQVSKPFFENMVWSFKLNTVVCTQETCVCKQRVSLLLFLAWALKWVNMLRSNNMGHGDGTQGCSIFSFTSGLKLVTECCMK